MTPRKILLAVSGMSPQIITETLYALIHEKNWIPDEIRLITTLIGKRNAVQQLLEDEKHFFRLLQDFGITQEVRFDEDCIIVIRDGRGQELPDLRTPEDNEAAANVISEQLRLLTSDPEEGQSCTELHVSLAGGRKTMGFYAGYALSLFGRPQDRLSHVLVSEHYESHPDFFYPTRSPRMIHTRDGQMLDTSKARVYLAEIPFVRLRNRLPETLLRGTHSFSDVVRLAREATEAVQLVLQPRNGQYSVNGRTGRLTSLQMALLAWVVERALANKPPIEPVVDGEYRPAGELLHVAERYWLDLNIRTTETLREQGITQSWLEQNISKLNSALVAALGPDLAERCKLASRIIGDRRGYALPDDIVLHIDGSTEQDE
ncbi:CRISPR-associated protein, NE0113 family [Halopseudomonas formosensis]|uniref:CRISPR-associated protein, NE0113 family n=1 Tax=Halopseudomonas formosensis TaxID=1002526 RepID=A0A1I6BMZ2_9GAMM|nr:CRISPR-associated ring nuclease Csm6 [Halopseudomonas formosensis]SFQ82302.1 CRISPR-associated protein, NE0113 family [Halopseudomonas formosensis]